MWGCSEPFSWPVSEQCSFKHTTEHFNWSAHADAGKKAKSNSCFIRAEIIHHIDRTKMRNWKRLSFMFSSHSSPVESGLDEKEAKKARQRWRLAPPRLSRFSWELVLHQRNVLLIYRQRENDPFIPVSERNMSVVDVFWLNNPGINRSQGVSRWGDWAVWGLQLEWHLNEAAWHGDGESGLTGTPRFITLGQPNKKKQEESNTSACRLLTRALNTFRCYKGCCSFHL